MTNSTHKTALVTGANSGLGFEAAAQLAEQGYSKVILLCRNLEKANEAQKSLQQKTGKDVFEPLAADMSALSSVKIATKKLSQLGVHIDLLLLNAGVWPGAQISRNNEGIETAFASTLLGHHCLTLGLLNHNLLSPEAKIIISSSELARGDFPGAKLLDIKQFSQQHFNGDLTKAILATTHVTSPYQYDSNNHYSLVKLFVSWWAQALSRRLPKGITVQSVSPGISIGTNAKRHQPKRLRLIMSFLLPLLGKSAPVHIAAKRYLDAAQMGSEENGHFFASRPGKFVGKMQRQSTPHLFFKEHQEACWQALGLLTPGLTLKNNVI